VDGGVTRGSLHCRLLCIVVTTRPTCCVSMGSVSTTSTTVEKGRFFYKKSGIPFRLVFGPPAKRGESGKVGI